MKGQGDGKAATAEEAYQVWKAVLHVQAAMVSELERRTAQANVLPPTWLDVLLKLSQAPARRLRMSDLAETTFLSRGGITRMVSRIEAEGLLRREPCPDDGRGAFAVLTSAGVAALKKAAPVYRRALSDHFAAHLTRAEARAAADALEGILAGNGWHSSSPKGETWHSTK